MDATDRELISQGLLMAGELALPQKYRRTLISLRREVRELRKLAELVREAEKEGVLS